MFFEGIWRRKIFHHNLKEASFFSYDKWMYNLEENRYSLLALIPELKPKNEKYYRFLLQYPQYDGYNIWEQDMPPDKIQQPDNPTYFKCINCTWKEKFGPIRRTYNNNKNQGLYNCCNLNANWWYAFGVISYPNNRLPGPYINTGQYHNEVFLWQQVDHSITKMTCSMRSYNIIINKLLNNIVFISSILK